jgi:mRNA interferase RelE/StbE
MGEKTLTRTARQVDASQGCDEAMWQIILAEAAQKHLLELDCAVRNRVNDRLVWFAANFDDIAPIPLVGEWRGYFKLRVGDIRIIYGIYWQEKIVVVRSIGRRDKVYD